MSQHVGTMSNDSLAAVFTAAGEPLKMERFPLPELAEGEVLVRVTCCTLCGSDLHTYQGRRSTPTPTILGHEILGKIAALGPGNPLLDHQQRPISVGDRITWSIAASCGGCFFCRHAIPQKCERLFKYGHEMIRADHPLSGGLAEYCHLARGTAMVKLPETLPDTVACPVNCATATVAAGLRAGGGCRDEVVLVQGAGMLGLTLCAMAHSYGAKEVIVCDVDEERLQQAGRFGASRCVRVTGPADELMEAVQEGTGGRGVDLALELSGATSAMQTGLKLLRIGGRYVLIGAAFPSHPLAVDPESVIRRLLTIRGVHNYTPDDLAEAVVFLSRNHQRYPLADLVSDPFPLSDADSAFQHAIDSRTHRVAVVS